MTAAAFELNPNFTSPARAGDLYVREILAEEFSNYGIVTRGLEESLAAKKEREIGRALVRTWEEAPEARATYEERKLLFAELPTTKRGGNLTMDPDLARAEIARLERSANPAEYEARINELLVEVLGEEPRVYGADAIADPILREDQITKSEAKWKKFLALGHHDKLAYVETETDLEFLDRAKHGPRDSINPKVRQAINARVAFLQRA